MRKHEYIDDNGEWAEESFPTVLAEALMALLEEGMGEDAHWYREEWQEIDDDEIELALNDPKVFADVIERLHDHVRETLQEVLDDRKKTELRRLERDAAEQ